MYSFPVRLVKIACNRTCQLWSISNLSVYILCYNNHADRGAARMQSYSQDLRDRVLWALGRGERPATIARRLEISRVWVYRVRDREQKTGKRTSYQIGGHRRSRVAEMKSVLCAWIEQEPDLSLAELCQRLATQGVVIKTGALWHQLNKWNLTFTPPARQRARTRGRTAGAPRVDRGSTTDDERRKASVRR
jgi:transposase